MKAKIKDKLTGAALYLILTLVTGVMLNYAIVAFISSIIKRI